MQNWFECRIRYDKMLDNGVTKTVTEPYLVDALSFTEAEARIIEEMKPFVSEEFTVASIKRMRFNEMFLSETGERYYKAKLYFITLNDNGSEKKNAVNMLVQASELKEVDEILEEEMKKTMIDYEIANVLETGIIDVFPYECSKTEQL